MVLELTYDAPDCVFVLLLVLAGVQLLDDDFDLQSCLLTLVIGTVYKEQTSTRQIQIHVELIPPTA